MIHRHISHKIIKRFNKGKAIILLGARQVGKTTMIRKIAEESSIPYIYWNCDEPDVMGYLNRPSSTELKQLIGKKKLVIIDEAQRIKDIGITSKLIIDNIKDVQLVLTGSSALELSNTLNEPLTGRKFTFRLYPLSVSEMVDETDFLTEKRLIESRVLYGVYPDVVLNPGDEMDRLLELTSSFLYKDLLGLRDIRKPDILETLTRALALQIGNLISYNELSNTVGLDKNTIAKYIDLLEKSFVIFRLPAFTRNKRYELRRRKKVYFWDNGIRNAVLGSFTPLNLRTDKGALWENFLISERLKFLSNNGLHHRSHFWRTNQGQEIDYVETLNDDKTAVEIKWNPKKGPKFPKTFEKLYPEADFKKLDSGNYLEFLT